MHVDGELATTEGLLALHVKGGIPIRFPNGSWNDYGVTCSPNPITPVARSAVDLEHFADSLISVTERRSRKRSGHRNGSSPLPPATTVLISHLADRSTPFACCFEPWTSIHSDENPNEYPVKNG